MKNLLIIEPHMSGHHGVYLRWIVRAALERNCRISIGTFEDSLTHPLFKKVLDEFRDSFEVLTPGLTRFAMNGNSWKVIDTGK